jgi:peptidoglycan/xylan/chitin deacetylase (PgdA/CDA1 family)
MLIVTYHAVVGPYSPVCCPPEQLHADLAACRDAGYGFVSLDDVARWLAREIALPARSLAVTFDDGYANVVSAGLPILQRLAVPATVYVIGARIGLDNQWPGQWTSIPAMPLATRDQLRELTAAGITIGSHTWTHARLPGVDAATLAREVSESADRLEQLIDAPVRHFAYPYGDHGPREVEAAKARYATAVSTVARAVTSASDAHDLPRLDCHDLHLAAKLGALPPPLVGPYLAARRTVRAGRRLMGG